MSNHCDRWCQCDQWVDYRVSLQWRRPPLSIRPIPRTDSTHVSGCAGGCGRENPPRPAPLASHAGAWGDVVIETEQAPDADTVSIHLDLDPAARDERRKRIERLREELPPGPKGDISL